MRLRGLFKIAFRDCGSSLRAALESPRYAELLKHHEALDEDAEMAALIDLLGETAIEEITRKHYMPPRLEKLARAWDTYDADDQMKACLVAAGEFESSETSHSGDWGPKRTWPHPYRAFLPRHFPSWIRGEVRLSCGAVGAILMAFAKQTGAPHYLVSVQRTASEALLGSAERLSQSAFELVTRYLPQLEGEDSRFARLQISPRAARATLDQIETYTFHQALLIQLRDGRWILVDPYMHNAAELAPEDWPVAEAVQALQGRPEAVAYLNNGVTAWHRETEFKRLLEEIEKIFAAVERGELFGPEIPILELPRAIRRYLAKLDAADPSLGRSGLLYGDESVFHWAAIPGDGDVYHFEKEKVRSILTRLEQQGGEELALARAKILMFLPTAWDHLLNYQGVAVDRRRLPHPSIAISDPVRSLGVRILLNIRGLMRPHSYVGAALLRFTEDEMAWCNALKDHLGERRYSDADRALLERSTERLSRQPRHMLHRFVADWLDFLDTCTTHASTATTGE